MSKLQLTSSKTGTLYFGYGTNLSPYQMVRRCPSSGTPIAVAKLNSWLWIINERGSANIVPQRPAATLLDSDATTVWGILYNLTPADEAALDKCEGWSEVENSARQRGPVNPVVQQRSWKPFEQGNAAYNKLYMPVKIEKWLVPSPLTTLDMDAAEFQSSIVRTLIYIDEVCLLSGRIGPSYIPRMSRAARECIPLGVPERWVTNTFSRYGISKDGPGISSSDILPTPDEISEFPPKRDWEMMRRQFLYDEAKGHKEGSANTNLQ